MVVKDIAGKSDFNRVAVATAMEGATGEVLTALCDAIIDQWMKRERHDEFCCVLLLLFLGRIDKIGEIGSEEKVQEKLT